MIALSTLRMSHMNSIGFAIWCYIVLHTVTCYTYPCPKAIESIICIVMKHVTIVYSLYLINIYIICSGSHHKLEATCLNQEQSINELKKQLDLSKGKCSKLEADLKLLENNKQSLATDSHHQLDILQQVIAILLNHAHHGSLVRKMANTL